MCQAGHVIRGFPLQLAFGHPRPSPTGSDPVILRVQASLRDRARAVSLRANNVHPARSRLLATVGCRRLSDRLAAVRSCLQLASCHNRHLCSGGQAYQTAPIGTAVRPVESPAPVDVVKAQVVLGALNSRYTVVWLASVIGHMSESAPFDTFWSCSFVYALV